MKAEVETYSDGRTRVVLRLAAMSAHVYTVEQARYVAQQLLHAAADAEAIIRNKGKCGT